GVTAVLPGIDLEGMAERAALMTRTDRKYLVPAGLAAELVHDLADDLHVLDIDRQRTFAYRSLYYDTPELLSYRTAATRRRRRFKVRRREYVDAGTSFLEVKTRTGRGDTEKVREGGPGPAGSCPGPAMAPCRERTRSTSRSVCRRLGWHRPRTACSPPSRRPIAARRSWSAPRALERRSTSPSSGGEPTSPRTRW